MNKETLDIFGQLLNGKQIVIGKPRQVGKTILHNYLEIGKLHSINILGQIREKKV